MPIFLELAGPEVGIERGGGAAIPSPAEIGRALYHLVRRETFAGDSAAGVASGRAFGVRC